MATKLRWLCAFVLLVGLGIVLVGNTALTQAQALQSRNAVGSQAAVGTAFTYQGQLKQGGNPASGTFDFQFGLYASGSGGSALGSGIVSRSGVAVANGLFTVQLDFGASAFDGSARYLEVAVRPTGGGSYTTLSPRQALTPAPYSLYSASAGSAASATHADSADTAARATSADSATSAGSAASVPWSGVTGKPALQPQYVRTVLVGPVGDGTSATANGTALRSALAGITGATQTNPYLLKLEPGVYDVGATALAMKPWVDIEGSGELTTKVRGSGSASANTGTVVGANSAELRFLTVENVGGSPTPTSYAIAIFDNGASPRLTHVTATASGGVNSYGVWNNSSLPTLTNVTVSASGGTNSYGVYNYSSSPTLTNVTATASGGSSGFGVYSSSASSPTMTNVTATASGGSYSYGVLNSAYSSLTMTNVTATASGGGSNYGVYNTYSPATIQNSVIRASGGVNSYGLYNNASAGYTVTVDNSQVAGSTSAIFNSGFTTRVGASKLEGGAVSNSGTLTCVASYNGSYTGLPSPACQ